MHKRETCIKIWAIRDAVRKHRCVQIKEGGEWIEDTILFGKYRLLRILGKGRSGTVYLARHLKLDEYRAIKEVPKSCVCYQQFRQEALLLKRLRHPGIPIVYDLEEEEYCSYLIEEFLEGDSLYDLMKRKGHLNQDAVIRYGIQICDLVHYLHSAEEFPILYLDLQPRNLLLCHEQIKLLDFDHAETLEKANESLNRYGTPGYCAPEQMKEGELGVYTDVYQIGAVLAYLLTGHGQGENLKKEPTGQLGTIIHKCLHAEGAKRYQSVLELRQELEELQGKTTSLIIIFAGTHSGVGVTHLAIGLCAYLTGQGCPCLYEEWNRSNHVRRMAENLRKEADSYGIYSVFGLPVKPRYGKALRLSSCTYPVVVRDYGENWEEAAEIEEGAFFLIAGGKWWEQGNGEEAISCLEKKGGHSGMTIIYNHVVPGAVRKTAEIYRCLRAPEFSDPFCQTQQTDSFYSMLTENLLPQWKTDKAGTLWGTIKAIFGKKERAIQVNRHKS